MPQRLEAAMRRATGDILAEKGRSHDSVLEIADNAYEFSEQCIDRALATAQGDGYKPACKAGCYYCCAKKVDVTAFEAFRIADYINSTFEAKERELLVKKVKEVFSRIHSLNQNQRYETGIPCPLLDVKTKNCRAYVVRPIACRGDNSIRRTGCEAAFRRKDASKAQDTISSVRDVWCSIHKGLKAGVDDFGLSGRSIELSYALNTIFENEQSLLKWLGGDLVFVEYGE